MNEADVKKAAQKIQNAQTFQELHDIMVAYVNLGDYKSPNAPAVPPSSEFDYHDLLSSITDDWDPFDKIFAEGFKENWDKNDAKRLLKGE